MRAAEGKAAARVGLTWPSLQDDHLIAVMGLCRGSAVPVAVKFVTLLLLLLCLSPCTLPFSTIDLAAPTGAPQLHDDKSLKDKLSSDAALAVPALRALALGPSQDGALPVDAGGPAARHDRLHTILRL